jgi:Phosphotransferase enzyme family
MNQSAIELLETADPFPALLGDAQAWQRSYGRMDGKGHGVLLYDRAGGAADIRAVALGAGPDEAVGIGAFAIANWADDPQLPSLGELARRWPDAVPVRYRPGKRCTLLLPRGGGLFIKALADDRGAQIAADARLLWQAAGAGEFGFRVARPAAWLPAMRLIVQHRLAGSGVAALLAATGGAALARRMGAANASLAQSSLRPANRFDYRWQIERTGKYARRMAKRLPAAEPPLLRIMAALARIEPGLADRPIHGAPHLHQWLLGDEGLALVDFDRFGLGDPELDAATFLAEADFEDGFTGIGEAYVAGFAHESPLNPRLVEAYRLHKHVAKAERLLGAVRVDAAERALALLQQVAARAETLS